MSFANRGLQEELQWTQRYYFVISELPRADEEIVLSSELRIYKKAATGGSGQFMMKVFQCIESICDSSTVNNQLLDSKTLRYSEEGTYFCFVVDFDRYYMPYYYLKYTIFLQVSFMPFILCYKGWQVLDVTNAVKLWQKDYHTNHGLLLEVTEVDNNQQIHPVAVGLSSNRDAEPNQEVHTNQLTNTIKLVSVQ